MPIILETDRLLLRTEEPGDEAVFCAMYRDPEVMRFLGRGVPDQTPEETRQRLDRLLGHHDRHGFGLWVVVEKATGAVLGVCGLKYLDGGPEIEVGYHLARAAWGKGYATEAAAACLRHGFERLRFDRIVGVVREANRASRRVLEKIGLRYEGPGRYYNTECLMYAAARPAGPS
jgi:ribosomal-protein-alanine N-acetyltransferase